jgi:hypothetical protein
LSKKKRDDSYFAADRRKKKKSMMIIVPIIIAIAVAATAGALLYQPPQVMAISGVECNRTEQLNYHVHTHINVFVDGREQEVPDDVGRLTSCLYWLHTHAMNGVIHVEAPQTREFTLGQFLDIWQQTHDSTEFFNSVQGMNVTAYVDGEQFEGSYRDVPLQSLEQIALVYGEPPADIPDEFNFAAENLTR